MPLIILWDDVLETKLLDKLQKMRFSKGTVRLHNLLSEKRENVSL